MIPFDCKVYILELVVKAGEHKGIVNSKTDILYFELYRHIYKLIILEIFN